jgi:hypothetical protein
MSGIIQLKSSAISSNNQNANYLYTLLRILETIDGVWKLVAASDNSPWICTAYSSLQHTFRSHQPAMSSPVLWQGFPTVDVPLPLGSQIDPVPQRQ